MAPQYKIENLLGRGSFGEVRRAVDHHGRVVAIKMIELENESNLNELLEEISLMRALWHDNIVRLFDSYIHGSSMWLCMEYCAAGSCLDMIKSQGRFREDAATYIIRKTLKGLSYIHKNNMIHRDIKAANILVTGGGEVKIADFGVGAQLTATMPDRVTFMGTPYWMAPEVIKGEPYDSSVDVWSLGITAIELVTGRAPLSHMPPTKAMVAIADGAPPLFKQSRSGRSLTAGYGQMVERCLQKEPRRRSTVNQLQNLPLLRTPYTPSTFIMAVKQRVEALPPTAVAEYVTPTASAQAPQQPSDGWQFGDDKPQAAATAETGEALHDLDGNVMRSPAPGLALVPARCQSPVDTTMGHDSPGIDFSRINNFEQFLNQPLLKVQKRAKRKAVEGHVEALRTHLASVDQQFPGFAGAFVEEVWVALSREFKGTR